VIHAEEQRRPDVAAKRQRWRGEVMPTLDPGRLVFLDETAAKTNMARTHGYAPKGQRLEGYVPYRRWQTTTLLGAMRDSGFIAPLVVDGAMTTELFLAYVQRVLIPELRPGDVVVMDNLSCHTQAGVRQALEGAGCQVLYQPPYSPEYNPIELAYSKLKRLLRKAAERTVEGLWSALGRLLDRFSPDECRNYFRHRGYAATPSWRAL
jgi:transposase